MHCDILAVKDQMSASSPNSYVEVLTPNVMVLRGGAFVRLLGLDEVMRTGPSLMELVPYNDLRRETRELVYSHLPTCSQRAGHVSTQ